MFLKTSTFMNTKKSHEVEVMSEIVACFAKYCNIQQVREPSMIYLKHSHSAVAQFQVCLKQ